MIAPGTVLLHDSSGPGPGGGRSLLFTDPIEILKARTPAEAKAALARLEAALAEGHWAAGLLGYELGQLFEERLGKGHAPKSDTPLLWLGLYRAPETLDGAGVERFLARHSAGAPILSRPEPRWDRARYGAAFESVRRYIEAGDIYQANLTFKADFRLSGDPVALYRALVLRQPVAYGALIETGEETILSLSPELFVSATGGRLAARPMKGTMKRGTTEPEDRAARETLAADPKTRAENLMIVDLLRNDLGRIAEIGSVRVTDLFTIETYRSLHQMTSGIEADLKPGIGLGDILAGLFPCGSVTGAPKIRAMEIIDALEAGPRGAYTGAIGRFAPAARGTAPDFALNVAIRTAVITPDGRGEIGIGGGVVADSTADAEYDEALLKMDFLADAAPPPGLIETLLFVPGEGYALLARHLDRLARSATWLGIPLAAGVAGDELDKAAQGFTQRMRVRLLLDAKGQVSVSATPLPAPSGPVEMLFSIAPERMASTDPYLLHKTTRRDRYDLPRMRAMAAEGVDEVVFLNERDELTEGSYTSLFLQFGERLVTPPLSSGLLAGTLREALIASGEAEEAVLHLSDLARADAIFLGNSVRGLVPARWIERPDAQPIATLAS